ncbi:MAG: hypothetical protein ACK4HF_05780 [Paracoccaceae bacterium]
MADSIEVILVDVRKAVLDGDYEQLAMLMRALEHAEAEVDTRDLVLLSAMKAEAERTAICLQAALSGVRTARRRVSEIAEAARGLTTYDREGTRATVPVALPTSRRV